MDEFASELDSIAYQPFRLHEIYPVTAVVIRAGDFDHLGHREIIKDGIGECKICHRQKRYGRSIQKQG